MGGAYNMIKILLFPASSVVLLMNDFGEESGSSQTKSTLSESTHSGQLVPYIDLPPSKSVAVRMCVHACVSVNSLVCDLKTVH